MFYPNLTKFQRDFITPDLVNGESRLEMLEA
jgi:hypothetical protein